MRVLRIVGSRGDHDLEDGKKRGLSRTAQLSWNTPLLLVSHIPRSAKMIHSGFLAKATFFSDTMFSYPTPETCSISVRQSQPAHEAFRDAYLYLCGIRNGQPLSMRCRPFVRHPAQTGISRILYSSSATLSFVSILRSSALLIGWRSSGYLSALQETPD